jgi:hypothetical protein
MFKPPLSSTYAELSRRAHSTFAATTINNNTINKANPCCHHQQGQKNALKSSGTCHTCASCASVQLGELSTTDWLLGKLKKHLQCH